VHEVEHPQGEVASPWCGKYTDLSDSYKSLNEALRHAGIHNHVRGRRSTIRRFRDHGPRTPQRSWPVTTPSWCPAASASAASKARSTRARYAREHKVPYLGICLGMQVATIEYARHVAGLEGANSTEFDPDCKHPVIALITEWKDADGSIQKRDASSDLGGTMRLGAQSSDVAPGTLAHSIYGDVVTERHRHRYEANVNYLDPCAKRAW
jgi:CTP synthase